MSVEDFAELAGFTVLKSADRVVSQGSFGAPGFTCLIFH